MQNRTNHVAQITKVLPFLRSVAAPLTSSTPAASTMEAYPSGPVLVETKEKNVRKLSPAAVLAHDARNALCSLELLAGLLREPGVLEPSYAHYASDIQSVAQALAGVINKFASLGVEPQTCGGISTPPHLLRTSESRKNEAKTAGEVLQGCTRLLRTIAGSKVEVHVSAEGGLPMMAIEEDALHRVLINLVKNSSEAMPSGGIVRITARRALSRTAPAILIHVSDNGPGIPAHALEHIFKPGFSSKRNGWSPATQEQCGLGLAIVRELVQATGGEVRVASTRKRGTTFELKLPCPPTKQ